MSNEKILMPYLEHLNDQVLAGQELTDRTGVKFVEVIGASLYLDPKQKTFDFGVKKTNEEYCKKELAWYDSQSRSIDMVRDVKIWRDVACKEGMVNSNYGWCIYSPKNFNQFDNVIKELMSNKDSRRAIMIYTRPNMWLDYNYNGRNDFMCTNYHHFFIRDNKLISIYNIRSNDLVFGFFNDFYWACVVQERVFNSLYPDFVKENHKIIWQASSLHVYERHFDLLYNMIQGYQIGECI